MGDEREWKVRCGPRTDGEWVLDHAPPAPERGERGVILVERAARDSAEAKLEQARAKLLSDAYADEGAELVLADLRKSKAQRDRLAVELGESERAWLDMARYLDSQALEGSASGARKQAETIRQALSDLDRD